SSSRLRTMGAKKPLSKILRELEAALKKSYPRKLAELSKAASTKSIDALEKAVGFELPEDLRTLWAWRGGGEGFFVDKDTDDGSEGWSFSAPDGVLADWTIW